LVGFYSTEFLLNASSTFYDSYQPQSAPTTPNQYSGKQIIINSGRLLFNTTEDHLMFSSKKSINLNAVQSVNIDVTGPFVVQAGEIFLGSKDANESVLLGDSTVELLKDIFTDISTLLNVMSQQVTRPTETGLGASSYYSFSCTRKFKWLYSSIRRY
jgi:hypothetical protein